MLLEARGVSAAYGHVPVLRNADCRIAAGRLTALVGPNGSGKSTLLRCFAQGLPPQTGSILLDEQDLYRIRPREAAARLAYVPQENLAGFGFTIRELVALGAEAAPLRQSAVGSPERIERALRDLDLETLAGRSLLTLSGGERQRAFIARALAQDPDFLLLDEPTAHLDLRHQQRLLQRLRFAARREGKAVLVVLHDLNLAAHWADDLLLLSDGQIVAAGTPGAVLTPERLKTVYQTDVYMPRLPAIGQPWALPLPAAFCREDSGEVPGAVHVLCGGGAGTPVLAALREAGVPLTAGILGPRDPDAETARALGIPYTPVAPFCSIGGAELGEDAERQRTARHVVVTPFPIGPMNVALLQAATEQIAAGESLLLLAPPGDLVAARDHTGGEGARLWQSLEARVHVVKSVEDLIATVLASPSSNQDSASS